MIWIKPPTELAEAPTPFACIFVMLLVAAAIWTLPLVLEILSSPPAPSVPAFKFQFVALAKTMLPVFVVRVTLPPLPLVELTFNVAGRLIEVPAPVVVSVTLPPVPLAAVALTAPIRLMLDAAFTKIEPPLPAPVALAVVAPPNRTLLDEKMATFPPEVAPLVLTVTKPAALELMAPMPAPAMDTPSEVPSHKLPPSAFCEVSVKVSASFS